MSNAPTQPAPSLGDFLSVSFTDSTPSVAERLNAIEKEVADAIARDTRVVYGPNDMNPREAAGGVLYHLLQARQGIIRLCR